METTALSFLLIALGATLIVAVIAILWQLKYRFGGAQEPQEPLDSYDRPAAKTAEAKRAAVNARKAGALVVAGKRFIFDYKQTNEIEVKRVLDLIKGSLALLKESKYPDVVSSRARECEGLIKKLKGITSLDEGAIGEIVDRFKQYAQKLANSLG
ncbi:MAG: hypothetical protein LBC09_03445 [Helicobacteraceae bacterium]|jgi:hypothetical protein|nr:hypothetical protein [Helicobacteraceae bacterium]